MRVLILHLLRHLVERLDIWIARRQRGRQGCRGRDDHRWIRRLGSVEPRIRQIQNIGNAADERAPVHVWRIAAAHAEFLTEKPENRGVVEVFVADGTRRNEWRYDNRRYANSCGREAQVLPRGWRGFHC